MDTLLPPKTFFRSRRDFSKGVAAGSGAGLRRACSGGDGASDPLSPSGAPWTGVGGVGDYRWSNGNTQAVMEAAHRVRDGAYPDASTVPVDETVDLVIVGGGFSGMTAAYEFSRRAGPGRTCLLLENHPIVGGEAKQNEFLVERSEEHTSELQSLMRISYAVFCLKKKTNKTI